MIIAEGTSLADLTQKIGDRELKKGTPVKIEMTLKVPVAHAFDLAGAEAIFSTQMPEGLDVKDVYSPDNKYQVVIDCESDPVHIVAIVAFIKAHWLAITLVTIGLAFVLTQLVIAIKVSAPIAGVIGIGWILVMLAAVGLIGYLAYSGNLPRATVGVGGGT